MFKLFQGEDSFPPLFLDNKSIKEVLEKASEVLLLSPSEELIEEAFRLIRSMKEDLVRLYKLPLQNVEVFQSRDSLNIEEIDNFYKKLVGEAGENFTTPHTIN